MKTKEVRVREKTAEIILILAKMFKYLDLTEAAYLHLARLIETFRVEFEKAVRRED